MLAPDPANRYPITAALARDLERLGLADSTLVAVNRYYYAWVVLGLLLPAAIGGAVTESLWGVATGFLAAGVHSTSTTYQATRCRG